MGHRRNPRGKLELTWMGKDQALIPTSENTYDYMWVDKNDPRASQTHFLIEQDRIGDPADGGIHDNLMVLGDSGDVLESLTRVPELAKKYVGSIKCIYIDPPFNTGETFDNYEDNLEHSVWLTFMRDRVIHMKKLLTEDGSIWVHLDDHENHRMRVLMDEVFGAENFIAEIVWQKNYSPRNDNQSISSNADFILVYAKNKQKLNMNGLPRTESSNKKYGSWDGDQRLWRPDNNSAPHNTGSSGKQVRSLYAIQHPLTGEMLHPTDGRQWAFRRERIIDSLSEFAEYIEAEPDLYQRAKHSKLEMHQLDASIKDLVLKDPEGARQSAQKRIDKGSWPEFYPNKEGFGRKTYRDEVRKDKAPEAVWLLTDVGHTDGAKKEVGEVLSDARFFDTPKPERLIERVLTIATNPDDIVMDVFAGSGTTAAVAHKMRRRWVTVELREDNLETYVKPRLEKVVKGEDPGGITTTIERVAAEGIELPNNVTAAQAQQFHTLLGRFEDDLVINIDLNKTLASRVRKAAKNQELPLTDDETKHLLRLLRKLGPQTQDLAGEAVRQLKRKARTRNQTTTRWHGGGGFTVAKLSPTWVDVLEDEFTGELVPVLTDAATGDVLRRSIAAELRYEKLEGSVFAGQKGRKYLAVIEGLATEAIVDELVCQLPECGAAITLVCDAASDGVHRYLTKKAPGSTLKIMPDDLFHVSKRNKDN